ncbi:hypothetical protein L596_030744 [Steinernema carpocapsae]|uniref:7TM GPCR serpentine receptor class x (Srx) domain-containing protein n=1 Tax=Steinernema carpocapsae TaxID=34508 RepID=A0A4U5LNM7_STECR|nr:hypothetical protein L596_030744 [Steinernema carpocapsae]
MVQLSGQWNFIINFSQNWISLILNSIHPAVLFTFNKDIRNRLKLLIKKYISKSKMATQVVSSSVAGNRYSR